MLSKLLVKAVNGIVFACIMVSLVLISRGMTTENHGVAPSARYLNLPEVFSLYEPSKKVQWPGSGRYLIVVFSSWCMACAEMHESLVNFHEQHPDLAIYGLAVDENAASLAKWLAVNGNPFNTVAILTSNQAYYLGCTQIPLIILVEEASRGRYFNNIKKIQKFLGGAVR